MGIEAAIDQIADESELEPSDAFYSICMTIIMIPWKDT